MSQEKKETQSKPQIDQQNDKTKYDIPEGLEEEKFFPLEPREFDEKDFVDLAQLLLSNAYLQVKSSVSNVMKYYHIIELEFYLKNEKFQDHYTHCDPDQKQFAHWYFHRTKPGGAFKGGTFKGLDLTLGHNGGYFGVLIRSIDQYFEGHLQNISAGPCVVVNRLLEDTGFKTVADLVQASESMDVRKNKFIKLVFSPTIPPIQLQHIYTSPRIGLGVSYPELQNKDFRFASKTKGTGIKKCTSLVIKRSYLSEEFKKFQERIQKNERLFA